MSKAIKQLRAEVDEWLAARVGKQLAGSLVDPAPARRFSRLSPRRLRSVLWSTRQMLHWHCYVIRDKRDPRLQIHQLAIGCPWISAAIFFYGTRHDGKAFPAPLLKRV